MKIIKKMLITLVLFLSLFFNTSTIFAGNNLSTTFNANNDELTVTVKNNSDKELSDVEYNLNLPNEYTAKYEVNPDYSLSPQKETTFKVKVSKSGDNVSNNGDQGTKTFTSSKKSLDNTGLTSELTVGAIVVLFLLVGVLLYFKKRKVFIILLMAGLGTQLTPRYSLASEKIRQTENFKDNVSLLEKNISVSLDISYLIEGNQNNESNKKVDSDSSINKNDSKENSNDGDKNNNNNNENKSDNGITNNDNVPKEVVVAGYAYSGKTNTVLEEKELKVFDGDKEIATVKTDSEGYFFTHLIQEKIYTIKGEDFEVTVTAKNTGDYEHNDIIGKITLGRELKDEHTYMKIKPSVVFLNEDIEYVIEGNTLKFNREINVKEGDKVVLAPSHIIPQGKAIKVEKIIKKDKNETILDYGLVQGLDEVLDALKYKNKVDISEMQVLDSENFRKDNLENAEDNKNRSTEYVAKKLTRTKKYGKNNEYSVTSSIEGGLDVDIDWNVFGTKRFIMEPTLKATLMVESSPSLDKAPIEGKIEGEYELTNLRFISPLGVVVNSKLFLFIDAKGKASIRLITENELNFKIGYNDGYVFDKQFKSKNSLDLAGTITTQVGLRIKPDIGTLGYDVVNTKFSLGPQLRGIGYIRANLKEIDTKNPSKLEFADGDVNFKGEVTLLNFIADVEIPLLDFKRVDEIKLGNKNLPLNSNSSNIDSNKNTINAYESIIDKYKQAIKYKKSDDPGINMSAIELSYTPALYKLGEKRMAYGYYDINGDGQDELIIFGSQGIVDIYTKDYNDGLVKLLPENGAYGVSLSPQITKDNKIIITGTKGVNGSGFDKHVYEVYDFEKNSRLLKLHTSIEGIGTAFEKVYPNKEQMSIQDFINNYEKKYKQNIVDLSNVNKTTLIDKDTDSSENIDHFGGYSNAQLALIGRALIRGSNPTEVEELKKFDFYKEGNAYFTGLGNEASRIKVERIRNGISVSTPQYNVDGERMKYVERVKYTYEELANGLGDGDLEIIDKIINELKNIGKYKAEEFEG